MNLAFFVLLTDLESHGSDQEYLVKTYCFYNNFMFLLPHCFCSNHAHIGITFLALKEHEAQGACAESTNKELISTPKTSLPRCN